MKRNLTTTVHIWRYMGKAARAFAGLLILPGILLAGCSNPFNPPETASNKQSPGDTPAKGSLVRLVIGETGDANARTLQPAAETLAGYRFAFSSGHEPVDITAGNSAEVYLADGTYTITATAYKAGGTVGNSGDAAAQGSIAITLSEGAVTSNGGVVPPIILYPGSGSGALEYSITSAAAVGGTMKLWYANGNPYYDFGSSGVLTIGASPALSAETYSLAAGRYILEIRLGDVNGDIALLREVVEIWAGVSTAIVFTPTVYLDPSAVPAYSGATLSATSVIGDLAIGAPGAESGEDEANAITYSPKVLNIANATQSFVLETDSLFADISWVANTGTEPGDAGYSDTPVTDFSSDNVLWVKVVSEDASTTRYYKFILTTLDSDLTVSGGSLYTYVGDTLRIIGSGTYSIGMKTVGTTTTKNRIEVASGVSADITLNGVKIDVGGGAAFGMSGATVNLTLNGTNELKSGQGGAGLEAPNGSTLTISAADTTHSLTATGGYYGAGIGGGNNGAGGSVMITGGTVTATGGGEGAGIGGGSYGTGGTTMITGGTVTATGGNMGAGIGGGYGGRVSSNAGAGGSVMITGGTVTATGGPGIYNTLAASGAGIGGGGCADTSYGTGGNGGTFTITGGTVTATGGAITVSNGGGGAGIGGGGYYTSDTATYNSKSGNGGIVTITGGVVTATAVFGGAGIGGGGSNKIAGEAGSITEISGNAVVMASSIQPALPGNLSNAIILNGTAATMHGNVTLQQDLTIPNGATLGIPAHSTLTIGSTTLTNNGTIIKYHGGVINGTVTGTQPVDSDLTITGGDSYTYAEGLLTVTANGTYTIAMRNGGPGTTADRIAVASGVTANITLDDVNIDVSGTANAAAFDLTGATVNLTLDGTNVLASGSGKAGIGGGTVAITGDTLTAAGGISGTITINDATVSATGSISGTITINDATVSATGNISGTIAITDSTVSATGSISGTVTEFSGNAVVFASSIQSALTAGDNATQAIAFNGATGTVYGDVTLQQALTIQSSQTLEIPAHNTLTIPGSGITLINNGAIIKYPGGIINGTVTGNQPVDSDLSITGGASYTYAGRLLTITGNGIYTIAMRGGLPVTYDDRIVVAPGITANITLSNVKIEVWGKGTNTAAFDMSGATVNLTLNGTNLLISDGDRAGLQAPEGSTLTISAADNSHSLTAKSGTWYDGAGQWYDNRGTGAGIGGGGNAGTSGSITINSGTVTAEGGSGGAGIGGRSGAGGSITINGGEVTAKGGSGGAGIGGGGDGAGGTITISGGTVTATADIGINSRGGAGIGGGSYGTGGTIMITGGTVTATGAGSSDADASGAGIGGGSSGAGGTITITGGTVTATGSNTKYSSQIGSAGIGGGSTGAGGTITISGGTVYATGIAWSAGIGGGGGVYGGAGGTVTITGGTIYAIGGSDSGIGIGGARIYDGYGDPGTITELSGNAVVFASSIAPTLTAGGNATQAIAFNGNAGTMYGNVTLQQDLTIPNTHTLDLAANTLTVGGVTLTNEGTINKNGGTIVGTVGGGGTVNN